MTSRYETIGERIRRETGEAITESLHWREALRRENDAARERARLREQRAAIAASERARWAR
jgi:hypothetical protein